MPTIIVIAVIVLVVLYVIGVYNGLVTAKMRIKEALSGIDVQLKRRVDLIPNLVETVKGYAKHEEGVFDAVTKARAAVMTAGTVSEKLEADKGLTGTLKSLFAVAEAYPELKANTSFLDLQKNLEDTEDKIAYSRQFYNSNVLDYNTKVHAFPSNIIAGMFSFTEYSYFEATDAERENVKVSF